MLDPSKIISGLKSIRHLSSHRNVQWWCLSNKNIQGFCAHREGSCFLCSQPTSTISKHMVFGCLQEVGDIAESCICNFNCSWDHDPVDETTKQTVHRCSYYDTMQISPLQIPTVEHFTAFLHVHLHLTNGACLEDTTCALMPIPCWRAGNPQKEHAANGLFARLIRRKKQRFRQSIYLYAIVY